MDMPTLPTGAVEAIPAGKDADAAGCARLLAAFVLHVPEERPVVAVLSPSKSVDDGEFAVKPAAGAEPMPGTGRHSARRDAQGHWAHSRCRELSCSQWYSRETDRGEWADAERRGDAKRRGESAAIAANLCGRASRTARRQQQRNY